MDLTTENAKTIATALEKHFPNAKIKTNLESPRNNPANVTATIQGHLFGEVLLQAVKDLQDTSALFSIYRSGTGLTIKFF